MSVRRGPVGSILVSAEALTLLILSDTITIQSPVASVLAANGHL